VAAVWLYVVNCVDANLPSKLMLLALDPHKTASTVTFPYTIGDPFHNFNTTSRPLSLTSRAAHMTQNYFHTAADAELPSWSECPLTEEQLDAIFSKAMPNLDSLLDVPVSTFSSA